MSEIYEVSQITNYIKYLFDDDRALSYLFIRGEISNYRRYPSGHHYFSLKDSKAAIHCTMFSRDASRLRFQPEDGMKVIIGGNITVYPKNGEYRLYCREMTPDGVGDLHVAFEQLKARLQKEGLFDQSRKKELPEFPHRIGVITSSAGAAVHDILRILKKRYPLCEVKLLAVQVQGEEAPGEIAAAIRYANLFQVADLLIVGRGGGSMEDLWAFNEEIVARAIAVSDIPVISAVGHEPDVTISDFVADLRAATPSNGAELAVPDQTELRQKIADQKKLLITLMQRKLHQERQRITALSQSHSLKTPMNYVNDRRVQMDYMQRRLCAASANLVGRKKERFVRLAAKLDAMSPLKVLGRGYCMTMDREGHLIKTIENVHENDEITVGLADGKARALVQEVIK